MYHRLTKREAYRFTQSAYRFMRQHEGIFLTKIPAEFPSTKNKHRKLVVLGLFHENEDGKESIEIDYRFDILATLIHELLHALHKDWTEKKVRKEERRHLRGLSQKQALNLLRFFANRAQVTKN